MALAKYVLRIRPRMFSTESTDEVDSQANVGHPGDVYVEDVCILFSSKPASAGRWISLRQ
jgi:hypothetical protein